MHDTITAQFENTTQLNLQLVREINLDSGMYYCCCILPNNDIVITDFYNDKLKVIDKNGYIQSTINISKGSSTCDVATVDDNHVVVSTASDGMLCLINIPQKKVIRTFKTGCSVYGISLSDRKIVFCANKQGIKELNLENGKVRDIINDKTVDWGSYIATGNNRICYTCRDTVTVLDSQCKVLFKFNDESLLRQPYGITIDDQMNIYVLGYTSNNLIVLSRDGKTFRQLLGKADGLLRPTAIHYDTNNKQLILVARFISKIQIYNIL